MTRDRKGMNDDMQGSNAYMKYTKYLLIDTETVEWSCSECYSYVQSSIDYVGT